MSGRISFRPFPSARASPFKNQKSKIENLTIASRGSRLALWQSEHIADLIRAVAPETRVEIEVIRTKGDAILDKALDKIGDKGLFTKELEHALLEGRADIAVHSLKDMETTLPEGLDLLCVTEREKPEDALVAKEGMTLDDLPNGATVATGSVRRRAQLLSLRPDLQIVGVRGNVETRLRKFEEEGHDGMILARAGLVRLGLHDAIAQIIPTDVMVPAVGQGALGIEGRTDDDRVAAIVAKIEHPATRLATNAERAFLRSHGGGCHVPVGAHATAIPTDEPDTHEVTMHTFVSDTEGRGVERATVTERVLYSPGSLRGTAPGPP